MGLFNKKKPVAPVEVETTISRKKGKKGQEEPEQKFLVQLSGSEAFLADQIKNLEARQFDIETKLDELFDLIKSNL